jgi:hypothetical protein
MSDRRASAALALAISLASCATGPDAARPKKQGFTADELLAAGDFDGAARLYKREIDETGGGDDALREKFANASVHAATQHARASLAALDAGDVDRAVAEYHRAESYAPGLPVVREARGKVEARAAAEEKASRLREQAKAALATDPAEAARLLDEAAAAAPGDADLSRMRREAVLRVEADRSAARAESAWAAGDRAAVVRELAASQVGGRPTARADALRRRIEDDLVSDSAHAGESALRSSLEFGQAASLNDAVVAELRDRLVDKLLASARDLAATDRPATAALVESEAKSLNARVATPSLDRMREAATTIIVVRPFDDATGGKVDGASVARALRERVNLDAAGGGAPIVAVDDSDAARAAHPDALVATGRVNEARQVVARLGTEDTKVSYRVGSKRKTNPELDALALRLEAANVALRAAQADRDDAAARLKALTAPSLANGESAPRLSQSELRAAIAAAQKNADATEATLKSAKDAQAAADSAAKSAPREIDEAVMSEHVLPVTTKTKTAQLSAHVALSLASETVWSQDVSAVAEHKETISDGFAPAGIPPDPDDTPDDAAMAAKAADRFAALAAGGLRAAAEAGPRRRLEAARAAERAGRRDEAAEGYAMYLLSTADVATPERADAARALEELLGVHVVLRTAPRRDPQ